MLNVIALTLFPEMFPGFLGHSLAGKALESGLWRLQAINIRDFAEDKHKTVDASPYGGGTGMVMRVDVLAKAIDHAKTLLPDAQLIYFTPRGEPLRQPQVESLKAKNLILLCGRFEGVDQRLLDYYQPLEISIGDYILSGGEVAALTLMDAMVRLIPGVIGKESALHEESFSTPKGCVTEVNALENGDKSPHNSACLLEYPHYTRPPEWMGLSVPEVLLSGNHAEIERWRKAQGEEATRTRRPDLWKQYNTCKKEE